ncbi:MAG: hypothetical protein JO352_07735 [Chloroflexi bacterium]|nr:hypothetical protein [Chloroflexota bacterium]MBV9596797.1 hypothetical protein [Chloroflexota bacterium]
MLRRVRPRRDFAAMEERRMRAVDLFEQRFLDRYLHAGRSPSAQWPDFPPARVRDLANIPAPFGTPVTWNP